MDELTSLRQSRCQPCTQHTPPLSVDELAGLSALLPAWQQLEGVLEHERSFPSFADALAFVNRVGALAEQHDHHPDILLHSYRHVRLRLTTHAAGNLTRNDLILAAQIDATP